MTVVTNISVAPVYMTRKYNNYTKELLEPIVASSTTYAECLRKLGLKPSGNHQTLQRNIDRLGIDTSHMTFLSINQGDEIKVFDGLKRKDSRRLRLINERGHACEHCKLSEWNGQPITLEMDHVDGNNRNSTRENLRLLCPNCHSQTPTWRGRKLKKIDGGDSRPRTDTSCETNS